MRRVAFPGRYWRSAPAVPVLAPQMYTASDDVLHPASRSWIDRASATPASPSAPGLRHPVLSSFQEEEEGKSLMEARQLAHGGGKCMTDSRFELPAAGFKFTSFEQEERSLIAARQLVRGGGKGITDSRFELPVASSKLMALCLSRGFTTVSENEDFQVSALLSPLKSRISKTGPFRIVKGDKKTFIDLLDKDKLECKKHLDVQKLQDNFYSSVKPALIARGLLSPFALKDEESRRLNHQYRLILDKEPQYLTSLDLMINLESMPELFKPHFLDFLSSEYIIIVDDWTIATDTSVVFTTIDHGLRSPEENQVIFKGECDASFKRDDKNKSGNGFANIAVTIWKGDQVICSEVYHKIPCSSSAEAEALAMYYLLKVGISLRLECLEVCTDNAHIDRIVRGEQVLSANDDLRDVYNLIRCLRGKYKVLISRWAPRESLRFVDAIGKDAQLEITSEGQVGEIISQRILHSWRDFLNGKPVFSLKTGRIGHIKHSAGKKPKGVLTLEKSCFLEVDGEEEKLCGLWHIIKSLKPTDAYVVIDDLKSKPELISKVSRLFETSMYKVIETDSFLHLMFSSPFQHRDKTNILLVKFDGAMEEIFKDTKANLVVTFLTAEEKKITEKLNIRKFSPLSFISFHSNGFFRRAMSSVDPIAHEVKEKGKEAVRESKHANTSCN